MGKFDMPAPLKKETPSVPEWESFGEVAIHELDGAAVQGLINMYRKISAEKDNGAEGKDIEYMADILHKCITIGDETPPTEWLIKAGYSTLKRLADIALRINGMSAEVQAALEKN